MTEEKEKIIVVGCGGAGLLGAWKAAAMGASVLLLERNSKPAIKILISGGGKCNVTHDGTMDELAGAFTVREQRFLKHAFHSFTNGDIRELLGRAGVPTFVREDGRVFPSSQRAGDVVNALVEAVRSAGGEIRLNERVTGIISENGTVGGSDDGTGKIVVASCHSYDRGGLVQENRHDR
jgi:predicted Rossmann fold flavoprotein